MTTTNTQHPRTTAVYLRCYPYDRWRMDSHRRALEGLAQTLGLKHPCVYLDNGTSSSELRPQLRRLLGHASMGLVGTVLVPGRWVFSLDSRTADAVVAFLAAAGTQVVELPTRVTRTEHCLAS